MSKTSAGVRTIALRISGTEEAKNEIADMGEDIDDFVVRTRSKTDQIIRDYTAVASNMYQGVSVLDPNGNLRSTYDILLDISRIYKEIQEEDKKNGTNRAQALVEQLAGKNRSNIAASILSNPKMLEDVYNASQTSQGSAQQELDKYLDSITGKLQKTTNLLHEMAATTLDSDGLKIILDIINALLSGVAALTEEFGGLNMVIGAVSAVALQKRGLGLFGVNQEGKFDTVFSRLGKGVGKAISTGLEDGLLDEMSNVFAKTNAMNTMTIGQFMDSGDFTSLNNGLKEYLNTIPAAERNTMSLAEALEKAK